MMVLRCFSAKNHRSAINLVCRKALYKGDVMLKGFFVKPKKGLVTNNVFIKILCSIADEYFTDKKHDWVEVPYSHRESMPQICQKFIETFGRKEVDEGTECLNLDPASKVCEDHLPHRAVLLDHKCYLLLFFLLPNNVMVEIDVTYEDINFYRDKDIDKRISEIQRDILEEKKRLEYSRKMGRGF
jgi:hypothetical protein